MAGTSKGFVYRPVVTRRRKGKKVTKRARFYWACYRDAAGIQQRRPLKLPGGDDVTDKAVAMELLPGIVRRVEHEAAGLTDPFVESASLPMRVVLAQ